MSYMIYNRIHKSLNEDIKLIFYTKENYDLLFYVLGTSGFIYRIIMSCTSFSCNCEDFEESKLCKHICFVLFKILKVFRFDIKLNEIKCVYQNRLLPTNFYKDFKFEEYEWVTLKEKYNKIKLYLRQSNFDYKSSIKFNLIYYRYKYNVKNNFVKTNDKCAICLDEKGLFLKCPICKNDYHINCILSWFEKVEGDKKCPTCSSYYWNYIYICLLIHLNKKIIYEDIKKIENF